MASLAHDPAPASDASPPEQAAHAHPLNLEDPLERVASLAAAGDLRKADELLQTLLEDRPSTKAHLTLGHLRLREHALDDAIEAFGQVAERDSLLAEAHYFQALAYRKAGRWEDAERGFRRALFLAPGLWQAGFLLGGTYQRLGRLRESQRELAWVRRLVAGELPVFNFQSHPVFLTWFELDVAKVRTLLEAGDSDTPLD